MTACTVSAQFVTFNPVDVPSQPSTSSSYGPFVVFQPVLPPSTYQSNTQRATTQPQPKTYNFTGYYKDGNGWHSIPIKITITTNEAKLSGYKLGNNWLSGNSPIYDVGPYDPQEVREHFNFKTNTTYKGTIYF